ncbi:MAG: hypothetical protein H5T98_00790 [Syntrophomonadaceae bacterium]|nr:hypothetical protein [Syntrophomonadaceae bacterium]
MRDLLQRQTPYRNPKWLAAVRSIECCVLCGAYGTEAAHRDEGKGMGQKTADCASAAICSTCHHEAGNGKNLSREERRAMMDKAIVLTLIELVNLGKVGVLK